MILPPTSHISQNNQHNDVTNITVTDNLRMIDELFLFSFSVSIPEPLLQFLFLVRSFHSIYIF